MGYVVHVGLGLQILELKILFQSDVWFRGLVAAILNVRVQEINNFGNNFLSIFFIFFPKSSCQYGG